MSKLKVASLLAASLMISNVYAGNMGQTIAPQNILFTGFEGSYTWADVNNFFVNNRVERPSEQGGGGRISVGMFHHYLNTWSISGEAGWGYYGKSSYANSILQTYASYTLYGFDLLFGVLKTYSQLDLFIKAGVMAETSRVTRSINVAAALPGGFASGNDANSQTASNIVPEVKAGGIYNFTEQLAVSVAFMYLAGWETQGRFEQSFSSTTGFVRNSRVSAGPPSFGSIMAGLQYSFA